MYALDRELVRLYQNGIETDDCIGYHGTSLESILSLRQTGSLLGKTTPTHTPDSEFGDLHIFPIIFELLDGLGEPDPKPKDWSREIVEEMASGYATDNARDHCFLGSLGLDINNEQYSNDVLDVSTENSFNYDNPVFLEVVKTFLNLGLSNTDIDRYLKRASRRKGIVMGISINILEHFNLKLDPEEYAFRINVPLGLDYRFISGLKPVGPIEIAWFEHLSQLTQ